LPIPSPEGGAAIRPTANIVARLRESFAPTASGPPPELEAILRLAARRASALLLVLAPLVEAVAVAIGISRWPLALAYDLAAELGILSAYLLARSRLGSRKPELPLMWLASVMIATLLFASWHLDGGVNIYALAAPTVPLALAAFAPLRPALFMLLGVEVAVLHPIALALVPTRWALDPWVCAALALSLAAMAATAARSQRRLWSALMDAREKALDGTRLKSEFLANMSHEIRTPMTAILGFTEELELALDDQEPNGPARSALATIRRNGDHLLTLINGILDLSKIEAGRFEVVRARFEPLVLVVDVLRLLGPRARAKRLALEARCDGPVPETISSDAVLLRQILINLVGNAVKFTAEGSVVIVVRLAATGSAAGHQLEFAVEDTGPGLDRAQQRQVFDPFTQVHAARESSGTGLGLSLSRRLAQLLSGDVDVDSQPGRGSTFRVRVATGPLEGVRMCLAQELDALLAAPVARAQPAPASLRGRVLVAEDGEDNQRLLQAILSRAGLSVEGVANGALACSRALAAWQLGEPFDVVLMDMQMPVMDGYEATRRLRQAGYGGAIVALTAHAMSGDRERCLEAGCDDYATKPVVRAELLARLESALAKARAAEA
jgi:signal transduction histidine kinase/ActR/RegA family two-component response regulator